MSPAAELWRAMRDTPCHERNCELRSYYDFLRMRTVIQHGDNEEAKLFVDDIVMVKTHNPYGLLRDWSERLHSWEDQGIQTDASQDEDFERLMRKFTR